jgi:hypothetical protein
MKNSTMTKPCTMCGKDFLTLLIFKEVEQHNCKKCSETIKRQSDHLLAINKQGKRKDND